MPEDTARPAGPLAGTRIIELDGLGPGPFCGMLLADLGADVLRVDRPSGGGGLGGDRRRDPYGRNKRSVAVDLKHPAGIETVMSLVESADALIDPFRPGVVERLGIGPDACLTRNPRLVFGRMTGWGQTGPLAPTAGHDLTYIALTGALWSIGRPPERPVPPLNLVGDFGGGALYLAFGLVSAILSARATGHGQVVDVSMVDGVASLMTGAYGYLQTGRWSTERGRNFLDGGAPYYDTYETRDGKFIALAPIEPQFYAEMLERLGLADENLPDRNDRANWDALRDRFAAVVRGKTRDEWCAVFEGSDACYAPVLDLQEAPHHPHNVARGTFQVFGSALQPAPAPRFSRTPASLRTTPPVSGQDSRAALADWGLSEDQIGRGLAAGAVRQHDG